MPESQGIRRNLKHAVRRLDAIERDLENRLKGAANQDVLFIALNTAQAGLSSLTDAIGEMREAYYHRQPHEEPEKGRFVDEPMWWP